MRIARPLALFGVGGLAYNLIELFFRGYTHWSMFIVGGICFIAIGLINEVLSWDTSFILQCVIGGLIVTAVEFFSGCIINLWLGWGVWDYSNIPFQICGQICLPYTMLWILLSAAGVILDDYLRYWWFGEEKPHYKIF